MSNPYSNGMVASGKPGAGPAQAGPNLTAQQFRAKSGQRTEVLTQRLSFAAHPRGVDPGRVNENSSLAARNLYKGKL